MGSADLCVFMHHRHKGAELGVGSAIGRSRIRDNGPSGVHICHRRAARFVGPPPGAFLSVPMIVTSWPDHQGGKMTFSRALVVGQGAVDEPVLNRCGAYAGTG